MLLSAPKTANPPSLPSPTTPTPVPRTKSTHQVPAIAHYTVLDTLLTITLPTTCKPFQTSCRPSVVHCNCAWILEEGRKKKILPREQRDQLEINQPIDRLPPFKERICRYKAPNPPKRKKKKKRKKSRSETPTLLLHRPVKPSRPWH